MWALEDFLLDKLVTSRFLYITHMCPTNRYVGSSMLEDLILNFQLILILYISTKWVTKKKKKNRITVSLGLHFSLLAVSPHVTLLFFTQAVWS